MVNNTITNKIEWLLIEDLSDFEQHIPQWKELVQKTQANLFCSPEWIMTWIKVYWQPDWQLKTILGYQNSQLIAIVPLYIQKQGKFFSIAKLMPLGQGEPEQSEVLSEFQDILLTQKDNLIYQELAEQIQAITFDQFIWHTVLNNSYLIQVLNHIKNSKLTNTGKRFLINDTSNYIAHLSKNTRSKWKRCNKKLQTLNANFIWVPEIKYDEYWQQLITFHQKRWNKKGKQGAFMHVDFIKFHNFFRQRNKIKISALLINQQPIAINYYLYDEDTLYFYQSGWNESKFAQLSPGFALHIWSILNNSFKNYDFMTGSLTNDYKNSFMNSSIKNVYLARVDSSLIKKLFIK